MLALLMLYLLLISACRPIDKVKPPPPNIIIILSDDQGWGDFSIHGNTNLATPNIDAMARQGVQFTNFYVQPVCSPTRAELLTGRYHQRGGVYDTSSGGERLDLDETTIAEVFKQAGYATAAYGKWHNGMQYPYHPNGRGFDDYFGFCSGHWGNYFSPMLEHNGALITGEGYMPDDLTDHSLEFINKHKDQPFFLYLPYNTPHGPMQVPDEWWNKFKDDELGMRADTVYEEELDFTRSALAMCENIDWNVGRILEKLKELELEDNTIILYFNDNGPNNYRWNGQMKGRKGSTDEGGVRSPLFMRWTDKIVAGKQVEEIAGAIDLLPTLAELADIPYSIPKSLDGRSLKPLLLNESVTWADRTLFSQWGKRISARSQQYRLDHEGGLFDITKDRAQKHDLSESLPDVKQQLMAAVERYRQEVVAEMPEKDERTFPLGHPGAKYTQVPARDGVAHGHIQRSNRWPNCSYFTNWTHPEDRITWEVEVPEAGDFAVTLYYTCPEGDEGSTFSLQFGGQQLKSQITEAHDPPLRGMENDRYPRQNSYVKDWRPLPMGTIHLEKGIGELSLQAEQIPGASAMDFRLLLFERK